jgi:NDP-sugar pyrophosphorylase family protein
MPVVGLIPAAGLAERLQPLEGSKEMLSVGGRAVMDHLVERMREAADEIVVITRPEKRDVIEHAGELGLRVVEGEPTSVSGSLRLGLREVDSDETVLLGFPDTLWEPSDGFAQLLDALDGADVVLGVFESEEPERSDVVVIDGDRVEAVDLKPRDPRSNLIWGCAAAQASALSGLDRHDQPGLLFDELAREGRVRAVRLAGAMIDVGTNKALARARRLFGP